MLAAGVAIGLVVAAVPTVRAWPVPALIWPLALSLLLDLVLMPLAGQGRIEPLTMGERAAGVIGAALIITIILAIFPGAESPAFSGG